MSAESRTPESAGAPEERDRLRMVVAHIATDVSVAAIWAALIVAIVLFSGVVSQFAYVDF